MRTGKMLTICAKTSTKVLRQRGARGKQKQQKRKMEARMLSSQRARVHQQEKQSHKQKGKQRQQQKTRMIALLNPPSRQTHLLQQTNK